MHSLEVLWKDYLLQVFMNIATGGFGTEITAQTDEGMKNSLGGAAYLLTGNDIVAEVISPESF